MIQPWITTDDIMEADDPSAEWAVDAAIWILYKLTGEKYAGEQTITEVYSTRSNELQYMSKSVQVVGGNIVHVSPNGQSVSKRLQLKHTPVRSIDEVRIGGKLLPSSSYQLRGNKYLVSTGSFWPIHKEIEITYTHGTNPPRLGIAAAIRLANELVWNDRGDEQCTLPERISSSVTRQGVSYTILDPQDFLDKGRTGITIVDLFINTANPSRAKKRPRVFSPTSYRSERIN